MPETPPVKRVVRKRTGTRRTMLVRRRVALVCLLALAVLVAAAIYGFPKFRAAQAQRTGRKLLDQHQYRAAALAVQRTLQREPGNLEANRIMADATDAGHSRQAIGWRQRVAELQPNLENNLAWADTALRFRDVPAAEQALAAVNEADSKTAAFNGMAGRVAQAGDDLTKAAGYFAKAVEMEPQSQRYRFGLAFVRLRLPEEEGKKEARPEIEKAVSNPEFRRQALLALIVDAMENKDADKAVAWGFEAQREPGATFEDRLRYLKLLWQLKRSNFTHYLAEFQEQALGQPNDVANLIAWLNENKMAKLSILWAAGMPDKVRSQSPVPAAIAESYEALNDWPAVKALISEANWGSLECIRLALMARVLRDEGEEPGWQKQWNAAVTAAADMPDAMGMLARTAKGWGWEQEAGDLLWKVAQSQTDSQWALKDLQQIYSAKKNTRGLLRVATRMAELNPDSAEVKTEFARLSFLLNANMDRALVLAREGFAREPKNAEAGFVYGWALHLQGKTAEGLKIMQAFAPENLSVPRYAAYYGLLLSSTPAASDAKKFLDLAEKGDILPEEKSLVTQAREKLHGRGL